MLNLQKEVERILHQSGENDSFMLDEQFLRTYPLTDASLVVSKTKKHIVVTFLEDHFEFQVLPYNSGWYPIQVVKGNEVIPIVINYENGRAHSARNWYRFLEAADEVAQKIMGTVSEVLVQDHRQITNGTQFEQMTLWQ